MMPPEMIEPAVTFAVVLPSLLVAHHVADHWMQTAWQARHKGQRGVTGRIACGMHVCTYTLTTIVTVGGLWLLFDLPITSFGFLLGQAVSAATHYVADRRAPREWLVSRWPLRQMGLAEFYKLGQPRRLAAWSGEPNSPNEAPVWLYAAGVDGPVPWDNPSLGTGAYVLDQSWHWAWLFVAALLTALV